LVIDAILKMQSVLIGTPGSVITVAIGIERNQLAAADNRHNGTGQLAACDLGVEGRANARQPLGTEAGFLRGRARQR
jgi:hypothetical protein